MHETEQPTFETALPGDSQASLTPPPRPTAQQPTYDDISEHTSIEQAEEASADDALDILGYTRDRMAELRARRRRSSGVLQG